MPTFQNLYKSKGCMPFAFIFARQNGKTLKFDSEGDVRKFFTEEDFVRLAYRMKRFDAAVAESTRIQTPVNTIQFIMRKDQ